MYIVLTLPPLPTYDNGEEIEEWYNNLNRRCGLVSLFLSRPNSRRFILQWLELRALAQPPTMITVVPSNVNANASNHLITEDQMSTPDLFRPRDTKPDADIMQTESQTFAVRSGEAKENYKKNLTGSEICLEERQENPVIPVQSEQSLGYERQFVAQRITDSGRDGHTNGVDVTGRNGPTTSVHWELPVKRARMDFNRSGCAICRAPEYDVTDMLQCWCTFFVGDGEIEDMH
ncbi:hypothetical protein CPB84DRAFT_1799000 [Gymnopilus junonius]|uniref:Uncharacterized protein n=1 Tax=Gymnopilus junonius TaxID=109634 RepID=A0A9P5NAB7_GYMJU|nr:hypothetical protein CPB84DRAFT_1799000 [Gymnopilus junonius]